MPYIVEDFEAIGSRLGKWARGGADKDIDLWVEKMYNK